MSTVTVTVTDAKAAPALHDTTQSLVEKLNDMASIDPKSGKITFVADAYERLLPADIPLSTVKALKQHDSHVYAAAFEVVGNLARQTAHKHQALTGADATLPLVGKDRFDISWNRSREVNAGIPKDGQPAEKKTVYGTMTGKLVVTSADASVGELNKVAKRQKAAAMEMFGTAAAK